MDRDVDEFRPIAPPVEDGLRRLARLLARQAAREAWGVSRPIEEEDRRDDRTTCAD